MCTSGNNGSCLLNTQANPLYETQRLVSVENELRLVNEQLEAENVVLINDLESTYNSLTESAKHYANANLELGYAIQRIQQLEELNARKDDAIYELQDQISDLQLERDDLAFDVENLEADNADLRDSNDQYADLSIDYSYRIEELQQFVTDKDKELGRQDDKISDLERDKADLMVDIDELDAVIDQQQVVIQTLEDSMDSVDEAYDTVVKERNEFKNQLDFIQRELTNCKQFGCMGEAQAKHVLHVVSRASNHG